ncbi:hypothetical protein BO86DRAFT_241053 [Aspergillus japonicus CBS 114.51]|uniref:BTB domain-containing protein n=1 Tax=Aspergillus japonicus CBS 114.51 TaxID=1448312 RepID=A0A8T8X883_ASPJA|nr:hypothetical protein BO86DRAFT_241053 [Aspergillus japonicus CBS 114.51]RAH84377.1 hypothetical protein BO86DRAFT_241053 [Aspergillus japonicus CBS 114.51]
MPMKRPVHKTSSWAAHEVLERPLSNKIETPIPLQELKNALANMRLNPKYSDFTILCGEESFPAHKCIVCAQSGFFSGAMDGDFIEATTNSVEMQEDPTLVKQAIEYLYTLDYRVISHNATERSREHGDELSLTSSSCQVPHGEVVTSTMQETPGTSGQYPDPTDAGNTTPMLDPLSFHILMYSLADRLIINGLKALAKKKVEYEMAQRLDAVSFPQSVMEIYNSTPKSDRGLRDLAVDITLRNLSLLRRKDEAADAIFQDTLLDSVPQFSRDLLMAMMKKSVTT